MKPYSNGVLKQATKKETLRNIHWSLILSTSIYLRSYYVTGIMLNISHGLNNLIFKIILCQETWATDYQNKMLNVRLVDPWIIQVLRYGTPNRQKFTYNFWLPQNFNIKTLLFPGSPIDNINSWLTHNVFTYQHTL